jgi:hypothetical protein
MKPTFLAFLPGPLPVAGVVAPAVVEAAAGAVVAAGTVVTVEASVFVVVVFEAHPAVTSAVRINALHERLWVNMAFLSGTCCWVGDGWDEAVG